MAKDLYIGVISGTSMDALDAVLVEVNDQTIKTVAHHSQDIPTPLRTTLLQLCTPGNNEIQLEGEADVELGHEIASVINTLLEKEELKPSDITAIGSHGQTIRHSVESHFPFTRQIGNPSIIAEQTGINTVADFRMADIAAGGQGAPLACLIHEEVFRSAHEKRIVLNLGGIANITLLSPDQPTMGFDTGPANTLMDQWITKHHNLPYDRSGAWARSGKIITPLLDKLLADTYILEKAPKSTGREYFNLDWLAPFIAEQTFPPEDVQRTLLEYSVRSIADAIKATTSSCPVLLCGGGVYNDFLIEQLQHSLPRFELSRTDEFGIHSQQVEAAAFALMAYKTINRLPSNLPSVTGASRPKVLGGIYLAS